MKKVIWILVAVMLTAQSGFSDNRTPREGVDAIIRSSDIADLLEWAKNSKTTLEDGLKDIALRSTAERRGAYRDLIDSVVQGSGGRSTELLMRTVLNRALTVDELLKDQSQNTAEQESLGRRILKDSITVALQVYVDDSEFLSRASQSGKREIPLDLPIASLGINSAEYYARRAMTAPSHAATLAILKLNLGLFYNDLNKSQNRRQYAPVLNKIAEINTAISNEKPSTPEQYLRLNRRIKAFFDEQIELAKKVPAPAQTPGYSQPVVGGNNRIGMTFAAIRPGTFMMGSPESESNHESDEIQHRVTLTNGFEIQTTSVTQAQWVQVMGSNPSYFKEQKYCTGSYVATPVAMCPNHPVEQVSFEDVQGFIEKMNSTVRDGYKYRLPTEAEWEYAARAGTQTAYYFGDAPIDQYAWYDGSSGSQTHEVAKLKPNAYGLYDMSGNVWQWVQDWYGDYSRQDQTNPLGAQSGSNRVLRGGSWYSYARYVRSAYRSYDAPGRRADSVGFRLARGR